MYLGGLGGARVSRPEPAELTIQILRVTPVRDGTLRAGGASLSAGALKAGRPVSGTEGSWLPKEIPTRHSGSISLKLSIDDQYERMFAVRTTGV